MEEVAQINGKGGTDTSGGSIKLINLIRAGSLSRYIFSMYFRYLISLYRKH